MKLRSIKVPDTLEIQQSNTDRFAVQSLRNVEPVVVAVTEREPARASSRGWRGEVVVVGARCRVQRQVGGGFVLKVQVGEDRRRRAWHARLKAERDRARAIWA